MSDHAVRVTLGTTPYATDVEAGAHTVRVDEPGALGGADTGPDPYALLLGSLGSCKAITASMYARRKEWALERVTVELSHERRGDHESIEVSMTFEGDLTDDQRERLLTIAGKCPVEKTITGDLRVSVAQAV